jgi:alkanesulfonate monooxygenase SsuD/methylene tetrahydromethanopterin reductase-like flavin-dependent oxidoreductase (luciferase family)
MMAVARLATLSTRATIGTGVLLLPLYPPAIVAKQFADLDQMTGGRMVLGAGVGGEYSQEFGACQVPVRERGRRMDESIPLLRALWSGQSVTSEGPFYPMSEVRIHPEPVRPGGPPVLIAGRKQRAMQRAVSLADGWFPYMYSPARYQASVARIHEMASELGRELQGFIWALWTFISIDERGMEARRRAAAYLRGIGHIDDDGIVDHVTVSGTPDEVLHRLQEFVDAGVEHFVFAPIRSGPEGHTDLFIQEELVPALPRELK